MIRIESILEQLTGKAIVEALVETLQRNFDDFAPVKEQYDRAIQCMREELGDAVSDEEKAIVQLTASNLTFSGFLGLKANLDHFMDPVARNFLDADTETYLRENTARGLPAYCQAQEIRIRFYELLTAEQQKRYEDITEYVSYLETAGSRLAHYCGYLLGNELLRRIVPGYCPDSVQTMQYQLMLKTYFGTLLRNRDA